MWQRLASVVCVGGLVAAARAQTNCDPLVSSSCLYPFPSDFWLSHSACGQGKRCGTWLPQQQCVDEVTGAPAEPAVPCQARVNISSALPLDNFDHPIDALSGGWDNLDGFSPSSFLQVHFPNDLLADSDASINKNSPRFWDIASSLETSSSTVLLDAATGERVPHWVELDHSFGDRHPDRRPLLIWPSHRLKSGTRYIVAIHNLHNATGGVVSTPTAFKEYVTGTAPPSWRKAAYKDIFGKLEKAGVAVDSTLQLAWDFTTASRTALTSRLLTARNDALGRNPIGPQYHITGIKDNFTDHIARRIEGMMYPPLYLNQAAPGKSARLVLDADGNPVYQGTMRATFEILIPRSVVGANAKPARVVQYGHGLFGDKSEVETGYLGEDADRYGYILIASDWLGLAALDEAFVADMMVTDMSDFRMVPDRCTQGMVNALMLMRMMKGPEGILLKDKKLWEIDNEPVRVDGTERSYFGNSQGGIMGALYMSVSTDVERGLVGVGGSPYSLLLPRSEDFTAFGDVIKGRYSDPLSVTTLLSIFQMLWDRAEPGGFIDGVTSNNFPDTPSHRVLFHYGLGDAQVTWLGCQMLARGTGQISMFKSNVREGNESFFGFNMVEDTTSITEGNAIVGFDFGAPTVPFVNVPAQKSTDAHEKPRRDRHAQDMMDTFFVTGEILNTCHGPCRNVTADQL